MKYIKTYKIFEMSSEARLDVQKLPVLPDIEFAIDIRNASDEEIKLAIKEFEKYTNYVKINGLVAQIRKDLNDKKQLTGRLLPWAWDIEICNRWGNKEIYYSSITTPGWGAGVKFMEDIITIKQFLEVGLAGVKDLVERIREERILKQDANKYNL